MSTESWKLLLDGDRDGPGNMARDEALLESVAAGMRGPSLRLYRWRPACLSLGVFQSWAQYAELASSARPPGVVRRITGGGAIWHDAELTYSVVLPRGHRLAEPDANRLYRAVHAGLMAGMARLGVTCRFRGACPADPLSSSAERLSGAAELTSPSVSEQTPSRRCADRDKLFCFDRGDPNDVVTDTQKLWPRKLIGSAARRLPTAVLQHGSIVLAEPMGSPPLAGATSLCTVLGRVLEPMTVAEAVLSGLAAELGVSWERSELSSAETSAAAELELKHRSPAWLRRR